MKKFELNRAAILNIGLDLAMEFGPNWLKSIQDRLGAKFPQLSQAELDEFDKICREAMHFGHAQLIACWREAAANKKHAFQFFQRDVISRYPWISEENLSHLFSQGCYYAYKAGEI